MKYWFDTEFSENGETIELISIGIVSEDNRKFYGVVDDYLHIPVNDWVKTNVIPYVLEGFDGIEDNFLFTKRELQRKILEFIGDDLNPEFWAYYASYDWIVLCQLFGTMMDLPKHFPKYVMDIQQWRHQLKADLPIQDTREHNALSDAIWNKKAWQHLKKYDGIVLSLLVYGNKMYGNK